MPTDEPAELGFNISGLSAAGDGGLWAVRDAPSELIRLINEDGRWTHDADWGSPWPLRYAGGDDVGHVGAPDAEAVTVGPRGTVYVAAERSNADPAVSRNTILEFDPAGALAASAEAASPDALLVALRQWELNAVLPAVGANRGIEAIAWLPPQALGEVAANRAGDGLLAVGLESDGRVRLVQLGDDGTATIAGSVHSGLEAVMAMAWIEPRQELWALCDATCGSRLAVLAPIGGRLEVSAILALPPELAALDLEGLAAEAHCDDEGQLDVWWSDDGATGGHAIHAAVLECGAVSPSAGPVAATAGRGVQPVVLLLAVLASALVLGGTVRVWLRRRPKPM